MWQQRNLYIKKNTAALSYTDRYYLLFLFLAITLILLHCFLQCSVTKHNATQILGLGKCLMLFCKEGQSSCHYSLIVSFIKGTL